MNAKKRRPVASPPSLESGRFSNNWLALKQTLSDGTSHEREHEEKVRGKRRKKTFNSGEPARKKSKGTDCQYASDQLWFDDVDPALIAQQTEGQSSKKLESRPVTVGDVTGPTKVLAMDCEMVGTGFSGESSVLARCAIVNSHGHTLLDKFVRPRERVTDFRTYVSGIRPRNLKEAEKFEDVQKEVASLLQGRILVGHAVHNDLKALLLSHPWRDTRDTSKYKPFKRITRGKTPSLKRLAKEYLGKDIQKGEHTPVEDAQAAMCLFQLHKKDWEARLRKKKRKKD